TALHGAAMFGLVEMARWLLEHGANPNAQDYEGKTPLKIALANSNEELSQLLREHGGVEHIEPEPAEEVSAV
ncbi:MAG TPA: ankyrin repeat domain-containing protein, partial [Chloroflexia bacterium]|nr:ankyrin repeat domain-containing protein [Chloroflexia bacterium]